MTSYPLAQHSWDDQDVITISSRDSQLIGTFPLEFLIRSGVSIWEYIYDVVRQLLDHEEGGRLFKPDRSVMTNAETPAPGDYCFVPHSGRTIVTFARGPEYFRRYCPPNPNGSQSTRSNSKRFPAQQSSFRIALIAMDFACLVTDAPYEECTACHIVPQSRPDINQSLLSIRYPAPIFSVSAGLLLRDDVHHAFDRLELSFYLKAGTYYLHSSYSDFNLLVNCMERSYRPTASEGSFATSPIRESSNGTTTNAWKPEYEVSRHLK